MTETDTKALAQIYHFQETKQQRHKLPHFSLKSY